MCAAVYAVITLASSVTQGLIAAKSRIAKKSLTIPRLELMSGHMTVNLLTNVRAALEGFHIMEDIQCWLNSTVALHLLTGSTANSWLIGLKRSRATRTRRGDMYRHLRTQLTWGAEEAV